jgi:arsenate reductase (glutaredoxin)
MDVIIYHNVACRTSRTALGLIRNAGVEPHRIEYLKTPPTRTMLRELAKRMGKSLRDLLRSNEPIFGKLGLDDPALSDDALLDAVETHPILLNRPIVVSTKGVKLCRPAELVLELLPPQQGEFFGEDGERIVDERGRRVETA